MSVARALINMTLTVPFAVLLSSCDAPGEPGVAPADTTRLDEDLQYFSELLDGEFDNFERANGSAEGGATPEARVHYVYRRVNLPAFGRHVVYVQQYFGAGDNAAAAYRQRIYESYADAGRDEVVTRIWSFPQADGPKVVDSQYVPSQLAGYTRENMTTLPEGCEIFWRRNGDHFVGYQKPGDCVMNFPNTEAKMMLADDLILSPTMFSTATRAHDPEGARLFGSEVPSPKTRVSVYHCAVSVEGTHASIRIHDQGGEAGVGDLRVRLRPAPESGNNVLAFEVLDDDGTVSRALTSGDLKFADDSISVECRIPEDPWSFPG